MKENNQGKTGKVILLAAVLLLAGGRPARAAEEDAAYLQSFKGNVEILLDEDSEWEPAEKLLYLYEGTEVRVGAGGEAVIKWERGHVMKLFALSTVKIEKMSLDQKGGFENSLVTVGKGKAFTKTNKLLSARSGFAIKTPTAVAGVRGTEFMVQVAQDRSSVISLLEGKLEVVGENVQMLLEENMQIEISADSKTPPEPTQLPAEIRLEMEAESGALDTSAEPGAGAAETEAKDESGSAGAAETSQTSGTETPLGIEGAQQTVEDVINNVAAGSQEQTADQAPDVPPMPPPR